MNNNTSTSALPASWTLTYYPLHTMPVSAAPAGATIEIAIYGRFSCGANYTVTGYQDRTDKVRARGLGGSLYYLSPTNTCRIISFNPREGRIRIATATPSGGKASP